MQQNILKEGGGQAVGDLPMEDTRLRVRIHVLRGKVERESRKKGSQTGSELRCAQVLEPSCGRN